MADRPGFMLYFDVSPALARVTDAEAGKLFKALFDYAQRGEVPSLDGMAGFAFDFIRPRLDRDADSYAERCAKSKYAVLAREAKKTGEELPPFEVWIQKSAFSDNHYMQGITTDSKKHRVTTDDIERQQTEHNHDNKLNITTIN